VSSLFLLLMKKLLKECHLIMGKVIFRYSDSNFCSYLHYLGYEIIGFDIVEKRGNKAKVFLHFEGIREELISLFKDFQNNNIQVNPKKFGQSKNIVLKIVKGHLCNYLRSKM